jgi:uncharacterized protein (DUF486 family)
MRDFLQLKLILLLVLASGGGVLLAYCVTVPAAALGSESAPTWSPRGLRLGQQIVSYL